MLFFLFYCVISVHGFGFQEALNTSQCMIACRDKDDWCLEDCTQPTGQFELDQTVEREADANVTLHCRGTHSLVIKYNPASYVIELQSIPDHTWSKATVSDGEFTMFKYLKADTVYRFRLYMLTQTGFTSPEISNWFLTYAVDYQPKAIKHISVAKFEKQINDVNKLQAEIMFQPAQDQNCHYQIIFSAVGGPLLSKFYLIFKSSDFRFPLRNLDYNQSYVVYIQSFNHNYAKVSDPPTFIFFTPSSCLEIYHSLRICAPEKVTGFRTKSILKRSEISHDIAVKWNKPILQPDNYTLQFKASVVKPHLLVVPGDAVEALFLNIQNIKSYEITIVAKSRGGVSLQSSVSRIIDEIPKMYTF
ncbi:PREDICTED: tyrosine-protein kinase receptor torso-like isoform X1 [Wasmannia auropunctata]|uniref:tyrosine-protein kinase receptor torso-like isoform X1 n=1 Tax=Wasmannia auropunctata TaxID=64793 RepID=UPI0005ED8778|nr:PREDICTED: tyrosine-protein kinase receptor torso-like isoform X1 [Wasmannia auropunctata]